jgi:hypothetical protein
MVVQRYRAAMTYIWAVSSQRKHDIIDIRARLVVGMDFKREYCRELMKIVCGEGTVTGTAKKPFELLSSAAAGAPATIAL